MTSTLAAHVTGPLLTPSDPKFSDEVASYNTAVAHAPQFVLGAASADDIATAVRFARDASLSLAIHATGHGADTPVTSGLLISTRRLAGVTSTATAASRPSVAARDGAR